MKKIVLSLSLLTLTLQASAQTQIGNSNFEAWENIGQNSVEPQNWNSFWTADIGSFIGSGLVQGKQVDRSTLVRPGSSGTYSARIWCRSIFSIPANGNLTIGRINAGSATANDINSNYNKTVLGDATFSESFTDTPDSLIVWVRYKPANTGAGHEARISCVLHTNVAYQDPTHVSNMTTTKAIAEYNIPYVAGSPWRRISIPFDYTTATGPTAYILTTLTTNKTPGVGTVNDSLFVDDIELVYVPKAAFTASVNNICPNETVDFTNTSTNYPTSYSWDFGDGSPLSTLQNPSHTYTNPGTYNVTLTATNQWGSTTSVTTVATTITVVTPPDASLSYAQATYCPADTDPVPTTTNAGTFTSTSGLIINSSTGAVDVSASTPGTYTVTNTYTGTCTNSGTTTITINPPANSSFAYPSNTICAGGANETPTVTDPGTFSATPAGLVFANATTGEINVSGSSVGTYTVTYDATGSAACPTSGSSSSVNITITTNPDASFTYAQPAYCTDATDPSPVFGAGANGGIFSSTAGLTINSNTGEIDLSASTAGTYTVTNTIAASGSCPMVDETFSITINALPNVTLANFTDVCVYNPAFALSGGTPTGGTYSGTGVSAGNFNPSTAGVGIETITYSYSDVNGCSNTATSTINVEECLGLNETEMAVISVYPNPTNGKLTLSTISGNAAYKIVSVSGQVVLSGEVSNSSNTIDIASFENGIYVLQLAQEQGIQTIRIVKK
jgi:PKD repeat protein